MGIDFSFTCILISFPTVCLPPFTDVPHFRYTGGQRGPPAQNLPVNLDGMCPHHEKAFAAHYVANHLQNFSLPGNLLAHPVYDLDLLFAVFSPKGQSSCCISTKKVDNDEWSPNEVVDLVPYQVWMGVHPVALNTP